MSLFQGLALTFENIDLYRENGERTAEGVHKTLQRFIRPELASQVESLAAHVVVTPTLPGIFPLSDISSFCPLWKC